MRPVRSLLIYIALVFGGGALLAPWLYLLAQGAARHWAAWAALAANPFYRFVLRSILGLAVLGLWPLLRDCRMLSRRELGLANTGRPLRNLAAGLAIGLGSLAAVALLATLCGGRALNFSHTGPEFLRYLRDTALAAILVAILEELIFRAALFGVLRKSFPVAVALLLSSAIYASVHFLQKAPAPARIGWLSGLEVLPEMFHTPPDGLALVPAFFTLLVAGAILALAYQRTGTLFLSIGLHAGWIFCLKSYRFLTRQSPGPARAFWGGDKLIDGWLPLLILAGLLFLMLYSRRPAPASNPPAR
ncbi:MAG: CPBP family intramembrane glutamic endopeptidase [Verrucomicrobiota bacterium]|jgi:membrane protease YdiL (CAAX protease family)